jgi:hypothetical protein
VPFLFGNLKDFLKNLVKNVQFRYATTGNVFFPPVANISWKKFLGALFDTLKLPTPLANLIF